MSIHTLPPEILQHIFLNLSIEELESHISKVSIRWKQIAEITLNKMGLDFKKRASKGLFDELKSYSSQTLVEINESHNILELDLLKIFLKINLPRTYKVINISTPIKLPYLISSFPGTMDDGEENNYPIIQKCVLSVEFMPIYNIAFLHMMEEFSYELKIIHSSVAFSPLAEDLFYKTNFDDLGFDNKRVTDFSIFHDTILTFTKNSKHLLLLKVVEVDHNNQLGLVRNSEAKSESKIFFTISQKLFSPLFIHRASLYKDKVFIYFTTNHFGFWTRNKIKNSSCSEDELLISKQKLEPIPAENGIKLKNLYRIDNLVFYTVDSLYSLRYYIADFNESKVDQDFYEITFNEFLISIFGYLYDYTEDEKSFKIIFIKSIGEVLYISAHVELNGEGYYMQPLLLAVLKLKNGHNLKKEDFRSYKHFAQFIIDQKVFVIDMDWTEPGSFMMVPSHTHINLNPEGNRKYVSFVKSCYTADRNCSNYFITDIIDDETKISSTKESIIDPIDFK